MTSSTNTTSLLSIFGGSVDRYADGYKRGYFALQAWQFLLLIAYAFGVATLLLYPLYNGEFWWVDDHQIVFFRNLYDTEATNIFGGVWRILQETEVVQQDLPRFRPIYFLFVAFKVIFLGVDPNNWFLYNFLLYTTCSVCFGLAIARRFPFAYAFLAITGLACCKFNNQLWPRLGPAEIEAMLGFSLAGLGLLWHRTGKNCRWTWALMCIGTTISIGCKENFLLMLFPLGLIFFFDLKDRQLSVNHLIWLIPVGLVTVPVIKMITSLNADVYSQPIGKSRYLLVMDFIQSKAVILLSAILTLYYSVTLVVLKRQSNEWSSFFDKRATKVNIAGFLAFIILFILAAGNFIVYSGYINRATRYAFPFSLIPLFGFYAAIYSASPFLHRVNKRIICRSIIIIAVLLSAVPFYNEIKERRQSIAQHIEKTMDFKEFREESQNYQNIILFNPFPTVIQIFELNKSLDRYAQAGLMPKSYLYPLFPAKAPSDLERVLTRKLKRKAEANPSPPLTQDTYLLANSQGKFMQVEHSNVQRTADKIITVPHIPMSPAGIKNIVGPTTIYVPFSYIPEKLLLQIYSDTVLAHGIDVDVDYDGQRIETSQEIVEGKKIVLQLDKTSFSPANTAQFLSVEINPQKAEKSNTIIALKRLTLQ